MPRLRTSFGTLLALLAMMPAAEAGSYSYSFSVGGRRVHVEAPRSCRSTSCVSISAGRGIRPAEDASVVAAPASVVQAPQPTLPVIPVRPPQPVVTAPPAVPVPAAPALAAATSQAVAPPPKFETPDLDPPRMQPPVAATSSEPAQTAAITPRSEEAASSPLGLWESAGAKGTVRIERCGPALCGYALTEASGRGESVLVNMKPKTHASWTGSIYSRSSGNTYYGTMTLKASGALHVEACAIGRFWCSGNDWIRVDERQTELVTTSRRWGGRS